MEHRHRLKPEVRALFGLIRTLFGVLLLQENVEIIRSGRKLWPFILVFIGFSRLSRHWWQSDKASMV